MRASRSWLLRLAQGVFVILGAAAIAFLLVHMTGNPASALAGGVLPPEEVARLAQQLGYDRPFWVQFMDYIAGLLRGDLGTSIRTNQPALMDALAVLPNTLILVAGAMAISLGVAVLAAAHGAVNPRSRVEPVVRGFVLVGQGIPEFWIATILILVFGVSLRWVTSIGFIDPSSLILPCIALAIPLMASLLRLLKSELAEVMDSPMVTGALGRGVSLKRVVWRHALPNSIPAVLTFIGLQIGGLIGGTVIIEAVFAWPGLGTLALNSVRVRDVPVVQAVVIVVAALYVILNIVVDLAIHLMDPRQRQVR